MVFVDVHEPEELQELIDQVVPTCRTSLNSSGLADYLWLAIDGHRVQVERKQMGEILSDLDGCEEQLRRHLSNGVEETILVYEGLFEPLAGIKIATQVWGKAEGKRHIIVPKHRYDVSYTGIMSWFYQLDKSGITVINTFDYKATAYCLTAWYKSSQKKEHTTLSRYIKPKVFIQEYNNHVLNLMSIKGANIGEERAKAIIERYGTFWQAIHQPAEDLAETMVGNKRLGMATVTKLLQSLGREA